MNITPGEYITNLKLIRAKEMLRTQNVTEVAYDLGYDNISYFITIFKNKYGITPKQYKSIGNGPVRFKTQKYIGAGGAGKYSIYFQLFVLRADSKMQI